uniref:PLAT domain-containing protein n=1 Tax=Acrobeloides nanus TaxID=290746 RepID=A0A914D0B9_9BILA
MPAISTNRRQTSVRISNKNGGGARNGTMRIRLKTPAKKLPAVPIGGTGSTADESDSGRPRSLEERSATHGEETEDDYPEGPTDEEEDEDDYKSSRNTELRESDAEDNHDQEMSPEYEEVQKTFGREYTDKENEAAVTIQKYTRGYLTRKHLKEQRDDTNYEVDDIQENEDFFDDEEDKKLQGESEAENESENDEQLDEDELQRRHEAAIVVQKHYRGFRARKDLGAARSQQQSIDDEEENLDEEDESRQQGEAIENQESTLPNMPEEGIEDEEYHRRHEAAIVIQKHYKGYRVRREMAEKKITEMEQLNDPDIEEAAMDSGGEQDSARLHTSFLEHGHSEENLSHRTDTDENFTYTVTVYTGNRWAADTEADLYLILHGDLTDSDKHHLTQDAADPKFRQNRMDTFHIPTKPLGTLRKVTIGHDHAGY